MDKDALKERTMVFALNVLEVIDDMPRSQKGKVISYQLTRSATSVGANYRAACRARSKAEYIAKLQIVLEEADESHFWLQLILRSKLLATEKAHELCDEANQLTAIFNSTLFRLRNSEA